MKNFEVPASNVIVTCTVSDTKPDKSNHIDNSKSNGNNYFQIGPLLPGMEKRYWVFIENESYRKTTEGASIYSSSFTFHMYIQVAKVAMAW